MPEPFGLTANGVTVVEDTFTIEDTGHDQEQAAPMRAAAGYIPAVVMPGTEADGAGKRSPPSPLKGEQKIEMAAWNYSRSHFYLANFCSFSL